MVERPDIRSPRLAALASALAQGDGSALDAFWSEIAERGAPLIEPTEASGDDACLITFVWRSAESLADVRIISLITGLQDNAMTRLEGTDLWFRSCDVADDVRATYQFEPRSRADSIADDSMAARLARYRRDPLNPRTLVFPRDEEDPDGFELVRSVLEMPNAAPQPWNGRRDAVPEGRLTLHRFRSRILDNERRVWVYTPAGHDPTRRAPYPLLVLFDGTGFVRMSPLTTILDNLIDTGRVPPLVAVMPCSISQSIRFKELVLHEPFNRFLVEELVPWSRETLRATDEAKHVVVAGASAGGLAAAYAAFEHAVVFGNVLSMSGAFSLSPGMLRDGWSGEHEWLTRRIATEDRRDVRFILTAGTLETRSMLDLGPAPSLVVANRHLRTVLEAKGYDARLEEFPGGHDIISWQGSIPEALSWLLGDGPREP